MAHQHVFLHKTVTCTLARVVCAKVAVAHSFCGNGSSKGWRRASLLAFVEELAVFCAFLPAPIDLVLRRPVKHLLERPEIFLVVGVAHGLTLTPERPVEAINHDPVTVRAHRRTAR